MTEHIFDQHEVGVEFTGTNAREVAEFLGSTHYEYTGEAFWLPSMAESVLVRQGDWLVKNTVTGVYRAVKGTDVKLGSEVVKKGKKK